MRADYYFSALLFPAALSLASRITSLVARIHLPDATIHTPIKLFRIAKALKKTLKTIIITVAEIVLANATTYTCLHFGRFKTRWQDNQKEG